MSPADIRVHEARKALHCLYLEAPESVVRDVTERVEAAFAALQAQHTEAVARIVRLQNAHGDAL